jgi:UDP-N-acetylmuramate--alanine ligase
MPSRFHFVGVAGSGMRPLAALVASRGHAVSGSDREFDRGRGAAIRTRLVEAGVQCLPQDGSGVAGEPDALVVSAAIEEDNPDTIAARRHGTPILQRAELLARVLNEARTIGVAGTNGKSTVTGMITWLLSTAGPGCTGIGGAGMPNFGAAGRDGFVPAAGELICAEVDESDSTVRLCRPAVAVVTNLGRDHMEAEEAERLFAAFCGRAAERAVVGHDAGPLRSVQTSCPRVTFGLEEGADLRATVDQADADGSVFRVDGRAFRLRVPGTHNVRNALAALAVARHFGVADAAAAVALATFRGVARRLQTVGTARGVRVVDDYAHNPHKIAASAEALTRCGGRVLCAYQPHGFGPTRFLLAGLAATFAGAFPPPHRLYLLPIFDAGGTADRRIGSADLAAGIAEAGGKAECVSDRGRLVEDLAATAEPGDTVVVMGARDNTLTDLCHEILTALSA